MKTTKQTQSDDSSDNAMTSKPFRSSRSSDHFIIPDIDIEPIKKYYQNKRRAKFLVEKTLLMLSKIYFTGLIKNNKPEDYVYISKVSWEKTWGTYYYSYLDCLIDNKFIQRTNSYETKYYDMNGKFHQGICYGYRLNPACLVNHKQLEINFTQESIKNKFNKVRNDGYQKKSNKDEVSKIVSSTIEQMTFDFDSFDASIQSCHKNAEDKKHMIEYVNNLKKHGQYYFTEDKNGRLYNPIVGMKRYLRRFLKFGNETKLVQNDVHACHPLLLTKLYEPKSMNEKEKYLKFMENFGFWKNLNNLLPENERHDISSTEGKNAIKDLFFAYLNGNEKEDYYSMWGIGKYFKKEFPYLHDQIQKKKMYSHSDMSNYLFSEESRIMKSIVLNLIKSKFEHPLIMIHDAIHTSSDGADLVQSEMKKVFAQEGLPAQMSKEYL